MAVIENFKFVFEDDTHLLPPTYLDSLMFTCGSMFCACVIGVFSIEKIL